MLFDSLLKTCENKPPLTHEQKIWLIDTINTKLNIESKEMLYFFLLIYDKKLDVAIYDIENIDPKLQNMWLEFCQMYIKTHDNESPY